MQLRFAAVCDEAHATPEGKLELHGVYHDLAAPGFPAKQDRMVLVLVLEWGREEHGRFHFRADLVDDGGDKSLTIEGETEVRTAPEGSPPSRSQLIMPMEGVIFPHAGQYVFQVKVKGETFDGPGLFLIEVPEEDATES